MPVYVNKEDKSNKFWSYDIKSPTEVEVKWGRIGLAGQSQIKSFGTTGARDSFISKKVSEKTREGYVISAAEKVKQESEAARELGIQFKVRRTEFVRRKGTTFDIVGNYDENQYIYVEVLNSWSKEVFRFILGTKESYIIDGLTEANRQILCASLTRTMSSFVQSVRSYLKKLSEKVVAVVKAKIGVLGQRKIDFGEGSISTGTTETAETPAADDFYQAVGDETASRQVVTKFAALGVRALQFD